MDREVDSRPACGEVAFGQLAGDAAECKLPAITIDLNGRRRQSEAELDGPHPAKMCVVNRIQGMLRACSNDPRRRPLPLWQQ